MIKRFINFFFCTLALIITIGVPIVAVYDALHPWSVAVKFVDQERANFFPIAVGVAATGSTITQKSYALIPKGLSVPTILIVNQAENGNITTEKDSWFFWLLAAFFLCGTYLIVKFTYRISAKLKGEPAAHVRR